MVRCCSPCDEVQSWGGGYANHDCLVLIPGAATGTLHVQGKRLGIWCGFFLTFALRLFTYINMLPNAQYCRMEEAHCLDVLTIYFLCASFN